MDLSEPQVMGILNVTPDSFYAVSRKQTEQEIAECARRIVAEGGTIIDVGACSTRPSVGNCLTVLSPLIPSVLMWPVWLWKSSEWASSMMSQRVIPECSEWSRAYAYLIC